MGTRNATFEDLLAIGPNPDVTGCLRADEVAVLPRVIVEAGPGDGSRGPLPPAPWGELAREYMFGRFTRQDQGRGADAVVEVAGRHGVADEAAAGARELTCSSCRSSPSRWMDGAAVGGARDGPPGGGSS